MINYRAVWGEDARYTLRHPGVRRGLTVLALALALLTIAGVHYHRIVNNEIGGLKEELEAKRREAVDTQYTKQLVAAYRVGKKQIALLEQKLQVQGVQSTLVHEVGKLCKLNAARVLAQSYQDGREEGGYAVLQHELVVAGSYYNLRKLIRDMERLPTLSFIEEASFSKPSESGGRLKLSLRLATYYRVADPQLVK